MSDSRMFANGSRLPVYLAGKVRGAKWQIARHPSLEDVPVAFYASDGGNHSEHDWGVWAGITDGGDKHLRDHLHEAFIDRLAYCAVLIAYLDSPDSFGSIAEIATAAQMGLPVYILIHLPNDEWDDYYGKMHDAYWFVSHLPNVFPYVVKSIDEAAAKARELLSINYASFVCEIKLAQTESPIEEALWEHLRPVLWIAAHPQYQIGPYRADFAIPEVRVVIECDGHDYHKTREQRTNDAKRDRYLKSEGWDVMRFTGTEISKNPVACANEVWDLYVSRLNMEKHEFNHA